MMRRMGKEWGQHEAAQGQQASLHGFVEKVVSEMAIKEEWHSDRDWERRSKSSTKVERGLVLQALMPH